ncbi:hypothetical protein D3C76_1774690 [compost metagenome]
MPSQCCQLGGLFISDIWILLSVYGENSGPKKQAKNMKTTTTNPDTASLLRSSRRSD